MFRVENGDERPHESVAFFFSKEIFKENRGRLKKEGMERGDGWKKEEERKGNRRFRIVHNEQQSENMKVGKYEVELRIETVTFKEGRNYNLEC